VPGRGLEPGGVKEHGGQGEGDLQEMVWENVDMGDLAIHRRVSRLAICEGVLRHRRFQAHLKRGISLAPGMEIGIW
jgi:hypothetical protein